MRYASVLALVGMLSVLSARGDEPAKEKESAVKAIDLKDVPPPNVKGGTVIKPLTLSAATELPEVFGKEGADKVAKQVDFAKQKLILFSWEGSGGDLLAVSGETPTEI